MYTDGRGYHGDWLNGEHHGHGTLTYGPDDPNNLKEYVGPFRRGQRHGDGGVLTWTKGEALRHVGEFHNDQVCNRGVRRYADGSVYIGGWLNGLRHSLGIHCSADGTRLLCGRFDHGQYTACGVPTSAVTWSDMAVAAAQLTDDGTTPHALSCVCVCV